MRKLVSGLAVVLVTIGLAACGGSTDAPANDAVVNETVFNDEAPITDNLSFGDNVTGDNALDLGNAAESNALSPVDNGL